MEFDLIIRNGSVIDGTGAPARAADVGIVDGKIAAVDRLEDATAQETIDATGRVVAPGFVDVHIHSETNLIDPSNPYRYGSLLQGVTTHLAGPDGFGWAGLQSDLARELWESTFFAYGATHLDIDWPTPEEYLALFPGNTPANLMPQVPHCAVRMEAMGWDGRVATDDELERMKRGVRAWMEAGASCLCLGLDYQPSAYSDMRELVELSKVAGEYNGIYAAHQRYNILGSEAAWEETIEIGRQSGIPVHVSHENIADHNRALIEETAHEVDLTFESYLYPAGCTDLTLMLPIWASQGGPVAILERLKDPATREEMRAALQQKLVDEKGTARIVFAGNPHNRYIGEEIADVAAAEGIDVGELAVRVIEEETPYSLMVYHRGTTPEFQEAQIRETVRHPKMMVASDGIYHGDFSHPRGFGCFARILRLPVREMGAITLEEAIRKMTGFPAERFRLDGRGLLKAGYGADVVIFDPETVADRATWDEPRLEPVGIDRVIVNGETVVLAGTPTGALPGQLVRARG